MFSYDYADYKEQSLDNLVLEFKDSNYESYVTSFKDFVENEKVVILSSIKKPNIHIYYQHIFITNYASVGIALDNNFRVRSFSYYKFEFWLPNEYLNILKKIQINPDMVQDLFLEMKSSIKKAEENKLKINK